MYTEFSNSLAYLESSIIIEKRREWQFGVTVLRVSDFRPRPPFHM